MSDLQTTPDVRPPAVVSNRDTTRTAVTRLLEGLGSNADQVAATLTAGGHRGKRGSCGRCPVANYLLHAGLSLYSVAVEGHEVALWINTGDETFVEYVPVPDAVQDFIEAFDGLDFPELDADGAR